MKWKTVAAGRRNRGWHRWFAWHPVLIDDNWIWLETVERLTVYHTMNYHIMKFYRYREIEEED